MPLYTPSTGITALTADVTATGPGSAAATLATVNGSPGSFTSANITVNAKGLVTAASNGGGGGSTFSGFSAHLTTNTSSGGEIITYDATDFNTGTQYDTSTGIWTVPTTGYWSVTMCFGYTSQVTIPVGLSIFGLWTGSVTLVVGEFYFGTGSNTKSGYTGTTIFHLTSGTTYQFIDGSTRPNTWGGGTVLTNDLSTPVCFATASYLGS